MPAGIQIWDDAGNLIIEYTDRVGRIIGQVTISSLNLSGSVTNAQIASGTPWFFFSGQYENQPDVSFAGTTMTWTQVNAGWTGTLFYGVR